MARTLNALRPEGKIDQIGVSIRDYRPDEGVALARLGLAASIAPYYATLAEAPIRYCLSPGQVATVIPGMKNPAEVDMNVAYSDGAEFPAGLAAKLAERGWPRNFYR